MTADSMTMTRGFEVMGPARLALLNVAGEIDIRAGEAGRIEATATKHPGRGADQAEIEMTQAADGSVALATRYRDDAVTRLLSRGRSGPCRVDYVVRVPRACCLDLSYVSGLATVAGLDGALKVCSVSGAMRLADLAGHLDLKTISGRIDGERLRLHEPLALDTVSGDVTLAGCHLPGALAETVSGRLHLEKGTAAGEYRFKSVSGNVHLTLPAEAACAVQMRTLSGRLRSRLPSAGRASDPGAAARVVFHSVSGNLSIEAPAGSPAAAPGPAPSAERLALLERVARGEVTVEGALSHLKL